MAIGRIPPVFFFGGSLLALKKKTAAASEGHRPAKTRFTNAVKALRNSDSVSTHQHVADVLRTQAIRSTS